jgi:hypothetical protein
MERPMATRIAQWRTAWICLALALALHVTDEALSGFLPVYNSVVKAVRAKYPLVPLPTFTFPVWLAGLVVAVLLLLALTPLVSRGQRGIRVASLILGMVMVGNALGHVGASLYWGKLAPGVYSSPVLFVAAVALLITASRANKERDRIGGNAVPEDQHPFDGQ